MSRAQEPTDTAEILAELGATSSDSVLDTGTLPLRFYGFMDVGANRVWGSLFDTGLGVSDALNFVVGNVNLYMDVTPSPQWRGLIEVRFTTLPNGAETLDTATNQFTRHSTTVYDYTQATGGLMTADWGSIILERAHIDWMPLDEVNVRAGSFLTPHGIWNVDHGSPSRIALTAPNASTYGFLPERQTGLYLFGVFHLTPWQIGYHAYVSNGRAATIDITDDKAVGGRLYLQVRRPIRLELGTSLFYGNAQQVEKSIGLRNGNLGVVRTTTVEYSELAGGADLSLDVGSLRLRIESAFNRTVYTPGKRPVHYGSLRANNTALNIYGVLAYQLPWWGIEPALFGELTHIPTPGIEDNWRAIGFCLNFYITPSVTIRSQITTAGETTGKLKAHMVAARLILTF